MDPKDISRGIERHPISIEQTADHIGVKDVIDFVYVLSNIPGPNFKRENFQEQFQGCVCAGEESCDAGCVCIERYGPSYNEQNQLLLDDPQLSHQKPILECNRTCECSAKCQNRVVQKGITVNLQVFKTETKGYGLKAMQSIAKHAFVCEYAGEVLPQDIAQQRANSVKEMNSSNYYIFALKEHLANSQIITTYVDPTFIGNVGRFINHSCEPNLVMVPVRVDNNIPKLALFALRDIPDGEELSFDYSGNNQIKPDIIPEKDTAGAVSTRKVCFCGSERCQGVLPFDESLFTVQPESPQ